VFLSNFSPSKTVPKGHTKKEKQKEKNKISYYEERYKKENVLKCPSMCLMSSKVNFLVFTG